MKKKLIITENQYSKLVKVMANEIDYNSQYGGLSPNEMKTIISNILNDEGMYFKIDESRFEIRNSDYGKPITLKLFSSKYSNELSDDEKQRNLVYITLGYYRDHDGAGWTIFEIEDCIEVDNYINEFDNQYVNNLTNTIVNKIIDKNKEDFYGSPDDSWSEMRRNGMSYRDFM